MSSRTAITCNCICFHIGWFQPI